MSAPPFDPGPGFNPQAILSALASLRAQKQQQEQNQVANERAIRRERQAALSQASELAFKTGNPKLAIASMESAIGSTGANDIALLTEMAKEGKRTVEEQRSAAASQQFAPAISQGIAASLQQQEDQAGNQPIVFGPASRTAAQDASQSLDSLRSLAPEFRGPTLAAARGLVASTKQERVELRKKLSTQNEFELHNFADPETAKIETIVGFANAAQAAQAGKVWIGAGAGIGLTGSREEVGLTPRTKANLEDTLIELDNQMDRLDRIGELADAEFLTMEGRASQAVNGLIARSRTLGRIFPLSPQDREDLARFAAFKAVAGDDLLRFQKFITGAQLSVKEGERIRATRPDVGDGIFDGDDQFTFMGSYNETRRLARAHRARTILALKRGVVDASEISKKSWSSQTRNTLEGFADLSVGGNGEEQIRRMMLEEVDTVAKRLAEENGSTPEAMREAAKAAVRLELGLQ